MDILIHSSYPMLCKWPGWRRSPVRMRFDPAILDIPCTASSGVEVVGYRGNHSGHGLSGSAGRSPARYFAIA